MAKLTGSFVGAGFLALLFVAGLANGADRYHEPSTDARGISIETTSPERGATRMRFTDPQVIREDVVVDDDQFTDVWIEGESHTTEPGLPSLPMIKRLIGIPDQGAMRLRVLSSEYTETSGVRVFPFQTMDDPEDSGAASLQKQFHWNREFYSQDTWYPSEIASLGEPAVLRDVRIATVSICPVQYNPATQTLRVYNSVDVEVEPAPGPGINEKVRSFAHPSRLFLNMYRELENYQYLGLDTAEPAPPGTYLIICANNATPIGYANEIAQWRRRKGIPTRVVTRAVTGDSYSQIRAYIQTAYNTWDPPLEYVLLLGDDTGNSSDPYNVPSSGGYGGSDHPYSQVAGNDILSDIAVGRLSAETSTSMDLLVTKTLHYEENPFVTGPDWFSKAYLLAGISAGLSSNVNTMQYIRHHMLQEGMTDVLLQTHSGSVSSSQIQPPINQGRSFFLWRGAWIGEMSSSVINGLSNGWMMPFVFVITCGTGNFASSTALSEDWVRYGSLSNGGGAVVCIGTATSGTHTRFNNIIAAGIGHSFFVNHAPEAGVALMESKLQLYRSYYPQHSLEVEEFSDWNNLMGDPALKIWTATPSHFDITHPSSVALGSNRVPILVQDDHGDPVEGALVCLMKGDETWTRMYTDDTGYLEMPDTLETTGILWLTVSKTNYLTYTADIPVSQQDLWVAMSDVSVDDDNQSGTVGNGDGVINPGETVDLTITAHNYGSSMTATNLSGTLSSYNPALAQVTVGQQPFPNLAPGAEGNSTAAFRVVISPLAQDEDVMPLRLDITGAQQTDTSLVPLIVVSGQADYVSHQFLLSNNRLDPGETENLRVTIKNNGHRSITNVHGTAFSPDPLITFPGPTASFGTITMGGTGTNSATPFAISANPMTFPGHPTQVWIAFTGDNGFRDTTYFQTVVGAASQSDPLGPDRYGYYCFDNTDQSYEMVPEYDWIEVDPAHGGTGINLPLNDNYENADDNVVRRLPFRFRMYGVDYDTITVCSNGWAAMGNQPEFVNFRNYAIPGPHGPDAMLAPFWDDLVVGSGHVCWKYVESDGILVIEWSRVSTLYGSNQETFEIILYDPSEYPTQTRDGMFKFQYQTVYNAIGNYDDNDYASVGIEDPTQTDGLQLSYWNSYSPGVAPLASGRAYLFTNMISMDVGGLRGQVTDAATGLPMEGVFVSAENAYMDTTDAEGSFFMPDMIVNDYDITCSKFGYNDATEHVQLIADTTIVQDFAMTHPEFQLDIDDISEQLEQGDTMTVSFHLNNDGNGELDYEIELDYMLTNLSRSPGSGIVAKGPVLRLDDLDDPWEQLLLVDVSETTNDVLVQGVAYAWNEFWVAGGGEDVGAPNYLYRYDSQGNYIDEIPQNTSTEFGLRDLAWDGQYLWGSENQYIVAIDSNGNHVDSILGYLSLNRALAYDPDEDVFYTGSVTAAIKVIDREGNLVREYADHGNSIYGLAWHPNDPEGYNLYMFCRDGNDPRLRITKMDPSSGDVMFVTDLNGRPSDRAGGAMITGSWNPLVWIFVGLVEGGSSDQFGVWELGTNTAWLSYSPHAGSVEANGQQTFNVLLDAREVLPYNYMVNLVFHHNAIGALDTLPVSLLVSPSSIQNGDELVPFEYALGQNYPNPFNPITVIPYSLKDPSVATLTLYNVLGQKVATLVNGRQEAGPHQATFDASALASGIYFYRLDAGSFTKTRKMVLLK
jgi:hypothetical protein